MLSKILSLPRNVEQGKKGTSYGIADSMHLLEYLQALFSHHTFLRTRFHPPSGRMIQFSEELHDRLDNLAWFISWSEIFV